MSLLRLASIASTRRFVVRSSSFPLSSSILTDTNHPRHVPPKDLPSRRHFHPTFTTSKKKAAKMGHHLETLKEMAHEPERREAQERRKKKKEQKKAARKKKGYASASSVDDHHTDEISHAEHTTASTLGGTDEIPDFGSDDDNDAETIFDHGASDNDNDGLPSLPDPSDVRTRMLRVYTKLETTLKSIRGAEPTPELFDAIVVKAYGTPNTPLSTVAQVVITKPNEATIVCYDPALAPAVRDALRDARGLNFNPRIDDNDGTVIVPMPKVSAETRKALVKQLGQLSEGSKRRIRNIRRGAWNVVKKGKDGKLEGISKDDAFRVGKEIDAVTEDVVGLVTVAVEQKQESVMAV